MDENTQRGTFDISGMHCAACARRIERRMHKAAGVLQVQVNLATERMDVSYDGEVIDIGSLGPVDSSAVKRAQELGEELDIDPAWVYAEERKESAHNPSAMAWNLHIMLNPKYTPGHEVTADQKEKLKDKGFPVGSTASYYGNNAKEAFSAAYDVNPGAAIAGGAWGLYQVLGSFTLDDYGTPAQWLAKFKSDPVGVSKDSFKKWIKSQDSSFKEKVNAGDYAYTTRLYYGAPNADYEKGIKQGVALYKQKVTDSQ